MFFTWTVGRALLFQNNKAPKLGNHTQNITVFRGGGAGGAGGANAPPKYRLGGPCPPNPKMATAT